MQIAQDQLGFVLVPYLDLPFNFSRTITRLISYIDLTVITVQFYTSPNIHIITLFKSTIWEENTELLLNHLKIGLKVNIRRVLLGPDLN
jgi:hypothetical protein